MKSALKILVLFLLTQAALADIKTNWEYVGKDKDVEVYKGRVKGTGVVAFRGVTVIDAPVEKILTVIHDLEHMKKWMREMSEVRILERQGRFDKIEYNIIDAPWPLTDRDFVYSFKLNVNDDNSITIRVNNATHPDAPESKKLVRGELSSSKYFLKPMGNDKTYFELELLADPKGSVPKWLVNITQESWPGNTLSRIRELATDPDLKLHPDVIQAMEENQLKKR